MKKDKNKQIITIVLLIVIISGLHYFTSAHQFKLHELYRRLYYIPIIIGSFYFRLLGGMVLPIIISILYLPYLLAFSGHTSVELISNIFEVIMFYTVGGITGVLSEKIHRTNEKNVRLEEEIQRADRLSAIGQLASGVAHEIRNPLAIIKTIAETLLKEQEVYQIVNKDQKEALEIIQEEVIRANKVINELLDFSRRSTHQKKEMIEIQKVIQNVVSLTNKYAEQKGVDIFFKNKDQLIYILGDREKLKQAFVNIIFNAIDAIENKGSIEIILIDKQYFITIDFIDTGRGIDKEKIDAVFNPFYTTKEEGVGLGLSITYRIIEDHEGTIELESFKDKGTKVSVSLPKVRVIK